MELLSVFDNMELWFECSLWTMCVGLCELPGLEILGGARRPRLTAAPSNFFREPKDVLVSIRNTFRYNWAPWKKNNLIPSPG